MYAEYAELQRNFDHVRKNKIKVYFKIILFDFPVQRLGEGAGGPGGAPIGAGPEQEGPLEGARADQSVQVNVFSTIAGL